MRFWGIAAIECEGPAADDMPSDVQPPLPAPQIPDPHAPIKAATASPWEFAKLGVSALGGGDRGKIVADPLAAEGRAVRLDGSLSPKVQRNPGLNWGWVQPIPTGRYRVTISCRAPQALTGQTTLTCSTANQAHEQNKFPTYPRFEKQHAWELASIPTDRYGVLTCELKWEEMDWSKPPVVLWQHVMKAKPDATVHATAGGHPAILTRPFGKGIVCFVTIAPLGDAPAGQTAFWDWPQWPVLMTTVVKELMP